ncbi:helix-turn-helix domain-containing protein [Kitasatospora sp. NPDC059463]|uniref:AraC family transcriptional regulator n=1 Tax=unclassified Kitasatospora TaxID=2633591 RepID=UPI00367FC575
MGARSGGTADERGENVERRPPPWMRGDVVRVRGYRSVGVQNPRVTLPSAAVTLLVGWGEPLHIRQGLGGTRRAETRQAMIAGLQTAPVLAGFRGSGLAVEIEFTAVGASRVLGLPLHLLTNTAAHPDEAMGPGWTARLTERLAQAPDWDARWAVVDDALAPRLAAAPSAPGLAVEAWQRLREAHGGLTARELAAATGRGERRLQRVFRDHVGVPPQTVSRILRFQRALALSGRAAHLSLTEVAAMSGYHDQAHMNRDFRALAGRTPGELRLVADRLTAGAGTGGAAAREPGCLSDFFEAGAADW